MLGPGLWHGCPNAAGTRILEARCPEFGTPYAIVAFGHSEIPGIPLRWCWFQSKQIDNLGLRLGFRQGRISFPVEANRVFYLPGSPLHESPKNGNRVKRNRDSFPENPLLLGCLSHHRE